MLRAHSMVAVLVLLPAFAATSASAEEPFKPGSPEAVVSKAFAALKENRLQDFADLMHADALRSFRKTMLEVVDAAAKSGQEKEFLMLFKGSKTIDDLKNLMSPSSSPAS